MEQQPAARLRKGEIAELVDDDEIDPHRPSAVRPWRSSFISISSLLARSTDPALTAEEAGELLRSIATDSVVALRDRALGVMVFTFTFARISAACGMNVANIFHQQRRLWVRLHKKGSKFHEMPCHHTPGGLPRRIHRAARLGEAARVPLFEAIKHRPYGRGQAELTGERLDRI